MLEKLLNRALPLDEEIGSKEDQEKENSTSSDSNSKAAEEGSSWVEVANMGDTGALMLRTQDKASELGTKGSRYCFCAHGSSRMVIRGKHTE